MAVADFDPDSFFAQGAAPPVAEHLGWTLMDHDRLAGSVKVLFEAKPEFLNFGGTVQGGIIAAMLDDTIGPAVIIKAGKPLLIQTIDLHTHFMRPVPLGKVFTEGQCTHLGRTIAYMEGKLFDADGRLCARATASARITEIKPQPS